MAKTIAPCEISRLQSDMLTGGIEMVISIPKDHVNSTRLIVDQMKGKKLTLSISEYRNKRSLDANAYFHVLVNKIAGVIGITNDECKIKMVMDYGTVDRSDNGEKAGAKIPSYIDVQKYYPYAKIYDTRIENGIEFNCYIFYKRTRDLDTKEMSQLISGVVYEAKELEIETMTPDEIAKMLSLWGGK